MVEFYNLTAYNNVTDVLALSTALNTDANGWLAGLLLLGLWVILIVVFSSRESMTNVMLGSSWMMTVIGAMLFASGFIPIWMAAFAPTVLIIMLAVKLFG